MRQRGMGPPALPPPNVGAFVVGAGILNGSSSTGSAAGASFGAAARGSAGSVGRVAVPGATLESDRGAGGVAALLDAVCRGAVRRTGGTNAAGLGSAMLLPATMSPVSFGGFAARVVPEPT